MQSLCLQGPWAHYEKVNKSQQLEIQELARQLELWQANYDAKRQQLDDECKKRQQLEHSRVPELENQLATASGLIEDLQTQVNQGKEQLREAEQSAAAAVAALQIKLEAAAADNAVLKAELAKAVQLRATTHAKVEAAKKHLGLNQPEAEFFIQELDGLRSTSKSLKAEVASLSADKARLEQQCDSRAAHALTLISENKRLLEQVADLRRQMVAADQDLWRLRQDLVVAQRAGAKATKRRDQPKVVRPDWQSGPTRGASAPGAPTSTLTGQASLQDLTKQHVNTATRAAAAVGASAKPGGTLLHDKAWNSNLKPGKQQLGSRSLADLYQVVGATHGVVGATHSVGGGEGAGLQVEGAGEEVGEDQENAGGGALTRVGAGKVTAQHQPGKHVVKKQSSSVAQAVQDAAAQLEELRRSALQKAMAARQQRLATHATAG